MWSWSFVQEVTATARTTDCWAGTKAPESLRRVSGVCPGTWALATQKEPVDRAGRYFGCAWAFPRDLCGRSCPPGTQRGRCAQEQRTRNLAASRPQRKRKICSHAHAPAAFQLSVPHSPVGHTWGRYAWHVRIHTYVFEHGEERLRACRGVKHAPRIAHVRGERLSEAWLPCCVGTIACHQIFCGQKETGLRSPPRAGMKMAYTPNLGPTNQTDVSIEA